MGKRERERWGKSELADAVLRGRPVRSPQGEDRGEWLREREEEGGGGGGGGKRERERERESDKRRQRNRETDRHRD